MKKLLLVTLLLSFAVKPIQAKDFKDCWMYMVSALPEGTDPHKPPVIKYRDESKWKKKLKDHLTKEQCLHNNKAKGEGCDGMYDKCKENQQPAPGVYVGLVGAWVQWGTSREACPKNCPGFEKVDIMKYPNY